MERLFGGRKQPVFSEAAFKAAIKMGMTRCKLVKQKTEAQTVKLERESASLLDAGKEVSARIKMEQVIQHRNMSVILDIVETMLQLMETRRQFFVGQTTCPLDMRQIVATLIYCADRVAVEELLEVRHQIKTKFGEEWYRLTVANEREQVHERILRLSDVQPPPEAAVDAVLADIVASGYCKKYVLQNTVSVEQQGGGGVVAGGSILDVSVGHPPNDAPAAPQQPPPQQPLKECMPNRVPAPAGALPQQQYIVSQDGQSLLPVFAAPAAPAAPILVVPAPVVVSPAAAADPAGVFVVAKPLSQSPTPSVSATAKSGAPLPEGEFPAPAAGLGGSAPAPSQPLTHADVFDAPAAEPSTDAAAEGASPAVGGEAGAELSEDELLRRFDELRRS